MTAMRDETAPHDSLDPDPSQQSWPVRYGVYSESGGDTAAEHGRCKQGPLTKSTHSPFVVPCLLMQTHVLGTRTLLLMERV